MNEKEIAEIRRRYRADRSGISRVRGCYVDTEKKIISRFNHLLGTLSQEESESLLGLFKKTLSGSLYKNLINLEFDTAAVTGSPEHGLLMKLRDSMLEDDDAIEELYAKISGSVHMETGYMILAAYEKYDVFDFSKSGDRELDSGTVFPYILVCVCPVKLTKPQLSYYAYDNAFHNIAANSVITAPEMGFMFPAFNDRAANIYNLLYYTRNAAVSYTDFVDTLFKVPLPMPAAVQRETFDSILSESVKEDCSLRVVEAIEDELGGLIEEHKQSNETEPLMISKHAVSEVLRAQGLPQEKVEEFNRRFDESFGEEAVLRPQNIISGKLEVETPDVSIKINPERRELLTTRTIDGKKYILIRAENGVEVNGVSIEIED